MIEATLFLILATLIVTGVIYVFDLTWVTPPMIFWPLLLLILPGLYAAVTSGPFVPSARKRHKNMILLADVQQGDLVYDLGCGDGRLLFSASAQAGKAIGYDLSIPLVLFGKMRSLFSPNVSIRFGNLWKQDYTEADVIFCYLLPNAMKQFFRDVWPTLKPGTRVVSNAFMIHDLKPQKEVDKVYLYIK